MELLIFGFIALMAFFKSIADTLQHHFSTSLFAKWTGNVWVDPKISWKEKYNFGLIQRYLRGTWFDLWHFSNSAMLMSAFGGFIIILRGANIPDNLCWRDSMLVLFMWLAYGVVFEFFYGIWQMLAPKNKIGLKL
jgi:hypothetical protein